MSNLLKIYYGYKTKDEEWVLDYNYSTSELVEDTIAQLRQEMKVDGAKFVLLGVFNVEC